jgi:hypothetical protein
MVVIVRSWVVCSSLKRMSVGCRAMKEKQIIITRGSIPFYKSGKYDRMQFVTRQIQGRELRSSSEAQRSKWRCHDSSLPKTIK